MEKNHDKSNGLYLILYRVDSAVPSLRWEEAVREALCFGWIDSTAKRIDHQRRKQLFTPRKKKSVWSKKNKIHIEELIKEGKMHSSGLAKIEEAKKNGSWFELDDVENLIIPKDLNAAFEKNKKAFENYSKFSNSSKKAYLYWLNQAKREETRQKRIEEIIDLCGKNIKGRSW